MSLFGRDVPDHGTRGDPRLAWGLFVLLWAAAVVPGVVAMRGVEWPYDDDGFRDLAIAESMRLRSWQADPFYRGESAWYSPLIPGIVALTSRVFGWSTRDAFLTIGPWLNAVGPLAFFLCARHLVSAWPALAATCAFLLLPGRPLAWVSATYTPWLFPSVGAQGFLYIGLLAWFRQLERPSAGRALLAGLLLGLTFLAHTAAAVLFAGMVLVTTGLSGAWSQGAVFSRRVVALVTVAATATLIALPFLMPIASQYGFRTLNRAPATWVYEALAPAELWRSLIRPSALASTIVVLLGVRWAWRDTDRRVRIILATWGTLAFGGLLYSQAAARWAALPAIVPAYHFYFLLRAWQWILFGCGFMAIAAALAQRLSTWRQKPIGATAVWASLVVLLWIALYPRYLGREAFTKARTAAIQYGREETDAQTVDRWIAQNADAEAVFLADDTDALRIVGPTGRRVICVGEHFSNPYVDHKARARARNHMWQALTTGTRAQFEQQARRYRVTHILARAAQASAIVAASESWVHRAFSSGEIVVLTAKSGVAPTPP
jgi:hypothetical protein